MKSILVHPENNDQMEKVKEILTAMNIKFEDQAELPDYIISKVEEGLSDYEKGSYISLEEFKNKYFDSSK